MSTALAVLLWVIITTVGIGVLLCTTKRAVEVNEKEII